MGRLFGWRPTQQQDPRDGHPVWLGPLTVTFAVVGALMATTGERGDRIWGLFAVALFGGGALALYVPKGSKGPGVTVERAEHRGGRWALAFAVDRRRLRIRVGASLVVAFAGLLIALFAEDLQASSSRSRSPVVLRVMGVLTVATFGTFGAVALAHRRTTPRVLLLENGIEFEGVGTRTFTPWDAITSIGIISFQYNEMIGVTVDDRARIETGPVAKLFLGFNRRLAGADLTYPLDGFVAPPQVVMDAIRRFADDPEERRRLGAGEVGVSELQAATGGSGNG